MFLKFAFKWVVVNTKEQPDRESWNNDIEFLLSCIAMSVGLGNVWRFPFTALENGGGAFLIPYLIVLALVGKPIYYLEMIIGQFSSKGAAKVYDFCPALRGVGIGQVIATFFQTTYYVSIMGLCVRYFVASFNTVLPWSICNPKWGDNCIPSNVEITNSTTENNMTIFVNISTDSSAELYFYKDVLIEIDNIKDGIGAPIWQLVLCLLGAWIINYIIIVRGIKSSGKASYFLAIFPYVVLIALLIRAVMLPGAMNGILYFIKPQWNELLNPKVWYNAVTQCFFSLGVCFGCITNYASFNKFDHNIYRDSTIVTLLDTFTSLLAGSTIFGILGHLAHEIGADDVASVVKSSAGLAFISYPDAIARFDILPQVFSVLFFALLFVLGVGSNTGMISCIMTTIRDRFENIPNWLCAAVICSLSFLVGLAYVTPGGQSMLTLIDFFGVSMLALILGICELLCLGWIYGVSRICRDTKFMINKTPGIYWKLCWAFITPFITIAITLYFFASFEQVTYKGVVLPPWAMAIGWISFLIGIIQVPIWAIVAIYKQKGDTWSEKISESFKPSKSWGPRNFATKEEYDKIQNLRNQTRMFENDGFISFLKRKIFS
ncbi:sodium-dependent nutrient amino acid transporter 1-like isoform X2 [Condylostylus longicornis]|uniref:sodium-dependent nutrient amino acid transporter 1-like isoform X2 n=1 Tax=Condylostylus longicornis TaxID=2530218 RepID=UPI00244DB0F4|nr:sodium-dependent nutrient amino acid transporter 1-like isoform X2 [Condylostylus longicornis]